MIKIVLVFRFAALAYGDYERASYSYRLEGFDDYWVDAGNSHEAFYANLPAGTTH
ncbi:MAG: hypothetical protein LKM34_09895 [Prevotella sp.]|jgi:hypothetical protein|nr:hypothetical protein [Prevotella sp.]